MIKPIANNSPRRISNAWQTIQTQVCQTMKTHISKCVPNNTSNCLSSNTNTSKQMTNTQYKHAQAGMRPSNNTNISRQTLSGLKTMTYTLPNTHASKCVPNNTKTSKQAIAFQTIQTQIEKQLASKQYKHKQASNWLPSNTIGSGRHVNATGRQESHLET